ncbi:MAG: hypothetical protein HRU26_04150 [Psychroserpens sp.]|nr:hypothetical protein [Psychroserpens sp.]
MKKLFFLICLGFMVTTCDDGDIINVTLDFEDTFSQCGDLVLFKINESTSETLSIQLPNLTLATILTVDENNIYDETFPLGSTNVFNYRSYGTVPTSNIFCNDVPPANLQIDRNEVSLGGEVRILTELIEDDNDGIPKEDEDLNNNGNFDDDDTDMDGIPNYLDEDDDGDNVLTANELDTENLDGDDNPLTNPLNSDANSLLNPDMIPDYLDPDDDGDGVLTRDEENIVQDENPANDVTDPMAGVDYLNPEVATTVSAAAYREHTIFQTYVVSVVATNLSLPSITQQTLDFGILEDSNTTDSRMITPDFN